MSKHPCKYLEPRKCCCCFNCDPRQVFLILSSTCFFLGFINMCSYPLCPAIIISSLVLAFYYFGSGLFLLYAVTGCHDKLLKGFPWLMFFSYVPIAIYVGCLFNSFECLKKWTTHYSFDETKNYSEDMFIGLSVLYSTFAVIDFLFSTYALVLSLGQFEHNKTSLHPTSASSTAAGAYPAVPEAPTQMAYPTISPVVTPITTHSTPEYRPVTPNLTTEVSNASEVS